MLQHHLLAATLNDARPDLENRVAFQWREGRDTLGYLHASRRDETVLTWMAEAVKRGSSPRATLDVGCAYGNYTLMLNAMLGRDQSVRLEGVDLHEDGIAFAREFAQTISGYENCHFDVSDIEAGLRFPDRSFDAVCLADVIEHLERPGEILAELRRVTKPGGSIIVSTPLKDGLFKRVASLANTASRGRVYRSYYSGKNADLDEHGHPSMETEAGHDHISEMTLPELQAVGESAGLRIADRALMSVMSGSRWFDEHPFLLAGLMTVEALHSVLRRPSWAHSVILRYTY
jgi:2-polyprenyl-3-methyl-5-hydroxy-6-metoxy-1,4-benzoquinol methylase